MANQETIDTDFSSDSEKPSCLHREGRRFEPVTAHQNKQRLTLKQKRAATKLATSLRSRFGARPIPEMTDRDAHYFWIGVDRRGKDDCWPWKGATSGFGHGRIKIAGKLYSPHRVAYTLACGPIPDGDGFHGTVIRHSCDNPICCNPAHLRAGTQQDNVDDMMARGRHGGTR